VTHAANGDLDAAVDVLARAGMLKRLESRSKAGHRATAARAHAVGSGLDAAALAASRAALLTSARDARATDASLDAARRLLALGKIQSASDVLLDFIGMASPTVRRSDCSSRSTAASDAATSRARSAIC